MAKISKEDFSIDEVVDKLKSPHTGAVVFYLGTVRDDGIIGFQVECQQEAEEALKELENQARDKFDVEEACIVLRLGNLKVTDNIALVAVAAKHRQEAFTAVQFLIDRIKEAPYLLMREIK